MILLKFYYGLKTMDYLFKQISIVCPVRRIETERENESDGFICSLIIYTLPHYWKNIKE